MTYYYIYQITNLVNNKIYVGVHKTEDLSDGYMGSGKVIKSAIEKYGIENFKKDILEFFENPEAMYAREKEIVTDEFLLREDVYNLRRGGTGGFDYLNKGKALQNRLNSPNFKNWHIAGREKLNYLLENDEEFSNKMKQMCRKNIKIAKEVATKNNPKGTFYGKHHRQETIDKMKQSKIGYGIGNSNSQYGTCWVYHELIGNKKIKKELLPHYIDQGWMKGRVYK